MAESSSSSASSSTKIIAEAQERTKGDAYIQPIAACISEKRQISGDGVGLAGRRRGKVRDVYTKEEETAASNNTNNNLLLALVTTDRQSGFDRMLAQVPYKGAVLNLTSAWWFDQTKHIVPNHLVDVPHPYVSIARACKPFPIEFVVRSYLTGSTSTSIWKNYSDGVRNYCGHVLPDGMIKNQKLERNILTPTTKEEDHDRPISTTDIVSEGWMTQADLDVCAQAALQVFALGQKLAAQRGLILVDTKYEFGRCLRTGEILLIDEVHTPDSSRYWIAESYECRMAECTEPENIDKEFLRLWFRKQPNCDPYNDEILPPAPDDLVQELARRYILLYELITGQEFDFAALAPTNDNSSEAAIAKAISKGIA